METATSPCDLLRRGLVWTPGLLAGCTQVSRQRIGRLWGGERCPANVGAGRRQVSLKWVSVTGTLERPGEDGSREEASCQSPSKQGGWADRVATRWWPHLSLCQGQGAGLGCQNQHPGSQSLILSRRGCPQQGRSWTPLPKPCRE